MTLNSATSSFYRDHDDPITNKRANSASWLRSWTHRSIHDRFRPVVADAESVLDAGCGDGALLARLRSDLPPVVIGLDMSEANLRRARDVTGASVVCGDLAALPFRDGAFHTVVSSHALEHLSAPRDGAVEVARVARCTLSVAMPTCLSPAGWVLLGRGNYWTFRPRSMLALPIGFVRVAIAWGLRREGVNEGYEGDRSLPHVWRFPRAMRHLFDSLGLDLIEITAGPLIVPWFPGTSVRLQRLQVRVDRLLRRRPIARQLGFGTHLTFAKRTVR